MGKMMATLGLASRCLGWMEVFSQPLYQGGVPLPFWNHPVFFFVHDSFVRHVRAYVHVCTCGARTESTHPHTGALSIYLVSLITGIFKAVMTRADALQHARTHTHTPKNLLNVRQSMKTFWCTLSIFGHICEHNVDESTWMDFFFFSFRCATLYLDNAVLKN